MTSPLEQLALAALSEEAIVARLANECARARLKWGQRGHNKHIQHVSQSIPTARGGKSRRFVAVIKELTRQHQIREKRRLSVPIDWAKYKKPSHSERRGALAARYLPGVSECSLLRYVGTSLVMVADVPAGAGFRSFLLVRDSRGTVTTLPCSTVSTGRAGLPSRVRLAATLMRSFHSEELDREAMRGGRVEFDFENLSTIVRRADNSVSYYGWVSDKSSP